MGIISLKLALPPAILVVVFAGTNWAKDANTSAVSNAEVKAKLQYCEVCHGPSAQGFVGYYPIPRLAGQQITYIKNQLQAFVERKRTNSIMINVAHVMSPPMIQALATNFHDLNPKPLANAPKEYGGRRQANL